MTEVDAFSQHPYLLFDQRKKKFVLLSTLAYMKAFADIQIIIAGTHYDLFSLVTPDEKSKAPSANVGKDSIA